LNNANTLNTCIIGVGNAGIKIATKVLEKVDLDHLFLAKHSSIVSGNEKKIEITIPSRINPSSDQIRKTLLEASDDILSKVSKYQSIIIVGNLASRFGSAVLPVLSKILKSNMNREIICVTILPFGFEKEKLFHCGVSLSFLCNLVNSVIVIDNNAIIRNGNDVSIEQCYDITNTAMVDIIVQSVTKCFPNKFNFVTSIKSPKGMKNAFIETMAQLTQEIDIDSIQKCSLYLYQPTEKISVIRNIIETVDNLLSDVEQEVNILEEGNDTTKCHILVNTNKDIVSGYDPLNFLIPKRNILDFEPEIAVDDIQLPNFKDIETGFPHVNSRTGKRL
jgi:cell division protein FtsZ